MKSSKNIKQFIKNSKATLFEWIKLHKVEFILLLVILVVAAILRLYKISEYMTFLGDEGRDVILVRRFLTEGDIMLIGPGTSIGNMYLGPLYYYMMAPALLLANFSPVGPAIMVALLGVLTVYFIWYVGRSWFGRSSGLVAALLYAIAPTIIIYSRSSWNPNIMPFFALLSVWGMWKVWRMKKHYWLLIVSAAFAACLQSHYLALLLAPALGLFWLLTLISIFKTDRLLLKRFFVISFLSFVLFVVAMSPLIIFDYRHGWRNFDAVKLFFTERQTTVSIKPWNALPGLFPQLTKISARLVGGYDLVAGKWIAFGILATGLFLVSKRKLLLFKDSSFALVFVGIWLLVALVGLSLYKQEIYDHYYGFFMPAPFLLIGALLGSFIDRFKIRGAWLAGTVLVLLVWVNLSQNPLKYFPNRQMTRSVEVTSFIREQSSGEAFNFAVIAERNYEGAYRYFFDRAGDRVTDIDPQNTKDTITNQLFVVCEMEKTKCNPTTNAKAEIANFGWSKVDQEWEVFGTTVYKLVNNYPTQTSTPEVQR